MSKNKIAVYIVAGMYNDDIDGITGNPYLEELVTTDIDKATAYYNAVSLNSNYVEIRNGGFNKVDNVLDIVKDYENYSKGSHECYMDITMDKCMISKNQYREGIDSWIIREYADYRCDTIQEKKLFFDGTVGNFNN